MDLRRYLELWTFIIETVIDYEDFESWTKCILHYAMFKYGPHRIVFFNKSIGTREWNVMVCISLDQGVAPSEVYVQPSKKNAVSMLVIQGKSDNQWPKLERA